MEIDEEEEGLKKEKRTLKHKIEGFLGVLVFPSEGALFFCREWKRFSSKGRTEDGGFCLFWGEDSPLPKSGSVLRPQASKKPL